MAYQLPFGGRGLQLGAAGSAMRYRLVQDFAALQSHGQADIGSAYALFPLLRARLRNLSLQAGFDHKRMTDRSDSTGAFSDKTVDSLMLGASGDLVDGLAGGGANSWSLSYSLGSLALDTVNAALDSAGHRSAGRYGKWSAMAGRQQRLEGLGPDWGLSAQISGQFSTGGKNLDSSEKLSLGGAQGVRAYPQGEAASDDAWLATLELRRVIGSAWQLVGFFDAGSGRLSHAPLPAERQNTRHLAGAGLSGSYQWPGGPSWTASLAWRTTGSPLSDRDRSPRLWTSLQQVL
jgi:hemolysin activation/secretion protein